MKKKIKRRLRLMTDRETSKLLDTLLEAEYRITCFYRGGVDPSLDRAIASAAEKTVWSSGMMIYAQIRDLGFEFKTLSSATKAAKRIKANYPKVRVILRECREIK